MRNTISRSSLIAVFSLIFIGLSWCAPARGAIGIDVSVSKDQGTASQTVVTPAFSTTTGNELLLAFVGSDSTGQPNVTVTGSQRGWADVGSGGSYECPTRYVEVWRAFAANPLSNVTVTATLSQSVQSSITVMSFTGTDSSGANGAGAIGATASKNASSGAPTASVVTTRASSLVVGVGERLRQCSGTHGGYRPDTCTSVSIAVRRYVLGAATDCRNAAKWHLGDDQ